MLRPSSTTRVHAGSLIALLCSLLLALACSSPPANEAQRRSDSRVHTKADVKVAPAEEVKDPKHSDPPTVEGESGEAVAGVEPELPKVPGTGGAKGSGGRLSTGGGRGQQFDVAAFVKGLPKEAIVFNVPETVPLGETVRVRLLIEPGKSAANLKASFEAKRTDEEVGDLAARSAPIGDQVSAVLASSGLGITPLGDSRKLVSAEEPTEWRWDVEAKEGGKHTLHLSVSVIPPERVSGREVLTLKEEMVVEVTTLKRAMGFLSDNWEWMWTFIAAPIGGYWWTRRRRRQRAEQALTGDPSKPSTAPKSDDADEPS